ncbi:uncharacterized protein LOC126901169 isoform X2 [Daktulosphaira vitifoliae]|uniref:uncharacterized protein LOC126901169 isoform X2 n=1 Tax=Daktulosphaira vitifoliae TaxID=58002 RepID=UPI0021AA3186|nr:uncharacterized protein LOC126901169 isoform X2 [Daktulosphaira vitifoliae]
MITRNSGTSYETRSSIQKQKQQDTQQYATNSIQSHLQHQTTQQNQGNTKANVLPTEVSSYVSNPTVSLQNNTIKDESIQSSVGELSEEKPKVIWPPKRKIDKKEQKKKINARVRRLVSPKSPLMVFTELYKNVPITLHEPVIQNNCLVYTATIEMDGQIYSGDHMSKTQAKQKACENFLRSLLAKKMSESIEKKEEVKLVPNEKSDENGTKTQGPLLEDFPWPHFASLAMHNLIAHWDLRSFNKGASDESIDKPMKKTVGMKKFPDNPLTFNPLQLLHQLHPGIQFNEKTITPSNPPNFEVSCVINNVSFNGRGNTKKGAKKECAIAAIRHLWGFDFNSHTV